MEMSANKRIFWNIVATYGRSVYSLFVGLFCGRWTLMSLGQEDYGLFGLVGGMTVFVFFLNGLLTSSVGRFYAVGVGAARKAGNELAGLENCRMWFNTALSIHVIFPLILLLIGYPIGAWAVRHFLTIPPDRVAACIWVWRFTCIACVMGIVDAPFRAMYTAKQEIAELTIYSFATTTLNAFFLYYMVSHPGVWLVKFSAWTCALTISPYLIISTRAVIKYPECRFRAKYLFNKERYRQLAIYAFSRFWSSFSTMISGQGRAVLVNKYMGPTGNAAMSIGNTVVAQARKLSGSLSGAFWPAIANMAGEGRLDEVHRLCFMTCRLGAVLFLLFALPLSLESHEVLHLWLVDPPTFAAELCIVILLRDVLEKMTDGYWMAVLGVGRGVMEYSWAVGWAGILSIFVSWAFFACGCGMWSICIGMIFSKIFTVTVRLVKGRKLINFDPHFWWKTVFFPIFFVSLLTLLAGSFVRFWLPPSFLRVVLTTLACEVVFLPATWFLVLHSDERAYLGRKFCKLFGNRIFREGKNDRV